jgi:hypothetical protein
MRWLLLCVVLSACDAENGEPDPPLANLVPCDADAGACPDLGSTTRDASAAVDATTD